MDEQVSIEGSVERVTFHNEENGYCVIKVKVRNQRDLVTLVGHVSSITPGEYIEGLGQWSQHREFGLQFKAQTLKTVHPSTIEGIEKYLGSGMVKGIGPHFAKKLVGTFQLEVFDIIENSPQRLREVPGIGSGRIQKITSAWKEQKVIREIMVFLQSHGVSTSRAVRIFRTYGQNAITQVKENPYQLAKDIHGIGFKSADTIAGHLGISKTSVIRARAGLHYALAQRINDGHCAYPEEDLLAETSILLEIEGPTLKEALELEIGERELIREEISGKNCIYPSLLYRHESEIAKLLSKLNSEKVKWGAIDLDQSLSWVEKTVGIELAPEQQEALKQSLLQKLLVITGGPGTGKTTLTRSILAILKSKGIHITLCSPTGRAAKRLSECTGMEAKTIHRLLGFNPKKPGFLYDQHNPLTTDLLIVDEASMIDVTLMFNLLKAIPSYCSLIIVGDVDQIPSVGPGQVLKSIIDSGTIPTIKLTRIFRQAAQSQIVQAAHQVNSGQMPDLNRKDKSADFHFIESEEPGHTLKKVIEVVKERIPNAFGFDPIKDIQVLSPMNRGILGGRSINIELQKSLNPSPATKIERFGNTFAPGDKVMVTSNDYDKEVFNGDIGTIQQLNMVEQEAIVNFDGREVSFDFNEMDILALAYATSIHKAQGSEYPAVVIPISVQHYMMLKRNLIYTGITRGKKLVLLIGQKKALAIAVKTQNQGLRWTNLPKHLCKSFPQVLS